jgi:hypothetical protein
VSASIIIGADRSGAPVRIDVEELLATRLLVQGNSGSGKSHLLRRMLEESAALVQQVVIDPEGDFVTLAEPFGHVVVDGSAYDQAEIAKLAARIRKHRASVILALDGLELEAQMRCAAVFLNTLFDAPRDEWYPALVVVDEAQMFASAAAGDVTDEVRRLSLAAMTNLMCRGASAAWPGDRHAAAGQAGQERRRRGFQLPDGAHVPRYRHGARGRSAGHGAAPGRTDPRSGAGALPGAWPCHLPPPGGGADR